MLLSQFIYVCLAPIVIFALVFVVSRFEGYYKKKKCRESPNVLQIVGAAIVLIPIFGFFFLPRVYIVDDSEYKKRILIGFSSQQLANGERVVVKGNCVVNNSTRTLYVETIDYMSVSSRNRVEKIRSYSVYQGSIDYVFQTPPKSITVKIWSSTVKKWLRERSFGEEY